MKTAFFVSLSIMFCLSSFSSASGKKPDELADLKSVVTAFKKAPLVHLQVLKKTVSEFSGEKQTPGIVDLAGSSFRVELEGPPKELAVFDGKTLWLVRFADPTFGGATQAVKTKMNGRLKDQMLLSQLLTKGLLLNEFVIEKKSENDGVMLFEGLPKKDSSFATVMVRVAVSIRQKTLSAIEYTDELGNRVKYEVVAQKNQKKINSLLFRYTPEKGVQVSEQK